MKAMVLTLVLAGTAFAQAPSPGAAVDAVVRLTPPAGWTRTEYANAGGADAVVAFENGEDRLQASLYGAPGSFYKTPREFLSGPAATTMGRRPVKAGTAVVAGKKTTVYKRGYPLADGDPHSPSGPARMATQFFCVLPPLKDGRFVVLAYSRESALPDPSGKGEKAWKAFLKSAVPAKVPGR